MCESFNRPCDPSLYPTVGMASTEIVPPEEGEIPAADLIVAAGQNSSISSDGQSVTRRSISELIQLSNHLAARRAVSNRTGWGAVGMARGIPPSGNGLG